MVPICTEKIKVLQFPVRNTASGVTQYALNNWKYIDKSRFQFDFATLDDTLDYEKDLTTQGCGVHYISCYAEDDPDRFCEEFCAILNAGYDAVHLHTSYWKSFAVEELAIARNIPVIIVHSHNTELGGAAATVNREEALALHNKQKAIFNTALATHFCACSRQAADWLFGPQILRENIWILNNAVDVGAFAYDSNVRERRRRELGLGDSFAIGHVGRFEYQKNHEFLIDVFAEVSKQISNAKLMLIGIGALLDEIKTKVQRLGLSDRVLFLGKRSDVAELYQAMDLFGLPSRFEGLPISIIEAQCSGLKCLTSDATPTEAGITPNLHYLPLEKTIWCNEIIKTAGVSYGRRDCSSEIAAAGYSIKEQIKVLERIYAGSEN